MRNEVPQEKDPRVYFSAERTLLAWIRTGLALMGFGFVVARFGLILKELGIVAAADMPEKSSGFSLWAGTILVLAGVLVSGLSAFQHIGTIRDLNAGRGVTGKPSTTGVALALLLAVVGLAMAAYLLLMR